jgi:hypothetical protein
MLPELICAGALDMSVVHGMVCEKNAALPEPELPLVLLLELLEADGSSAFSAVSSLPPLLHAEHTDSSIMAK